MSLSPEDPITAIRNLVKTVIIPNVLYRNRSLNNRYSAQHRGATDFPSTIKLDRSTDTNPGHNVTNYEYRAFNTSQRTDFSQAGTDAVECNPEFNGLEVSTRSRSDESGQTLPFVPRP